MDEQKIKTRLVAENEEFKNIFKEHQIYEHELDKFQNMSFLSEEDSSKMKEIKRKKLVLKDRMYRMMADFRKTLP
jgi:uncharacterized protein